MRSRMVVFRESWRRFVEFVPSMRRTRTVMLAGAGIKAAVVVCLVGGWWTARNAPARALLVEGALLLSSGAFLILGLFRLRVRYRERYGDLAFERLLFRSIMPMAVGGLAAMFFPLLVGGEPLLPPSVAYALAAYGILTALLIESRGREPIWSMDLRAFVYSVYPERGPVISSGIYHWLRHPVYSSFVRFVPALALLRNSAAALGCASLFCIGIWILSQVEERELEQRDPSYADYRRSTPGFFVARPLPFYRYLLTGAEPQARVRTKSRPAG